MELAFAADHGLLQQLRRIFRDYPAKRELPGSLLAHTYPIWFFPIHQET